MTWCHLQTASSLVPSTNKCTRHSEADVPAIAKKRVAALCKPLQDHRAPGYGRLDVYV